MALTKATNYGECRCCLAKGDHIDLTKEYYSDHSRETYSDIFVECYNLYLCSDMRLSSLICGACVRQLSEAHNFKKTVINSENKMLRALRCLDGNDAVFINCAATEDIKQESDAIKEETMFATDREEQMEYLADDDDLIDDFDVVSGEKELLARFPRSKVPLLPTRATLAALCPAYVKRLESLKGQQIKAKSLQECLGETKIKPRTCKKFPIQTENRIRYKNLEITGTNNAKTSEPFKTPVSEKMAHVNNISTILENSNVTAFMTKFKNGYPCFYCKRIFEQFQNLREHQTDHSKENIQKLIMKKYRKGRPDSLVVYVDVKDLKCTLCSQEISNINELKTHLMQEHKKTLYTNYTDRVIPFQISDKYLCQVCSFNFETFGAIERHMNTHYRNYVCMECGAGFIAKHRLKIHTYNIHSTVQGKFPCDVCKKTFPTHRKFKIHNDFVHKLSKKLQCPKCPARFSYYYVRQKHLLDVHGETPVIYKCNVCEKEFKRRYPLSIHIKKEHLNQGDFNCEMCSYMCYSSNELRLHVEKRHGERLVEKSAAEKRIVSGQCCLGND